MNQLDVGQLMCWAILHSHSAHIILDVICSSIISPKASILKKTQRVYLLSDILYNSPCGFPNAWRYRSLTEPRLAPIFMHFAEECRGMGRMRAEALRKTCTLLFGIWESWSLFSNDFITKLRNDFNDYVIPSKAPISDHAKIEKQIQISDAGTFYIPLKVPLKTGVMESKFKPIGESESIVKQSLLKPINNALQTTSMQSTSDVSVTTSTKKNVEIEDSSEEEEDKLEAVVKNSTILMKSAVLGKRKNGPMQMKLGLKSDLALFKGDSTSLVKHIMPQQLKKKKVSVFANQLISPAKQIKDTVQPKEDQRQLSEEADPLLFLKYDDSIRLEPDPEIDGEPI